MKSPYARMRNVKPFQQLMERIRGFYGSITKACQQTGISEQSYTKLMNDDDLSAYVARKILDHYNSIKGVKSAA